MWARRGCSGTCSASLLSRWLHVPPPFRVNMCSSVLQLKSAPRHHRTMDKHTQRFKLDSILEVPPEPGSGGSQDEATLAAQAILDSVLANVDEQAGGSAGALTDGSAPSGKGHKVLTPREKPAMLSPERMRKRGIPEELISKDAVLRSDLPDAFTPRGTAITAGGPGPAAATKSGSGDGGPGEGREGAAPVGQVARPAATWKNPLTVRLVLVFDRAGGVGSRRLTGRLLLRKGGADKDATAGAGEESTGGQGSEATAVHSGREDGQGQPEEIVVNGEFVRMLEDGDVARFVAAAAAGHVFEGITSFDQLFNAASAQVPRSGEGAGGLGAGDPRQGSLRGAAEAVTSVESDQVAARKRFVVKFEGKVISQHGSRLEAEEAQLAAELQRLDVGLPQGVDEPYVGDERGEGRGEDGGAGGLEERERVWQERVAAVEGVGALDVARGHPHALRRLVRTLKEDPAAMVGS